MNGVTPAIGALSVIDGGGGGGGGGGGVDAGALPPPQPVSAVEATHANAM